MIKMIKNLGALGLTFILVFYSYDASSNTAPYNFKWGDSYEDVRNKPIYSLEVSDIQYTDKDPNSITATIDTLELGISDYDSFELFFDKIKGLKGLVLEKKFSDERGKDNGALPLSLYNKEVSIMDKIYGQPITKEEFMADKNKFSQSLMDCIEMQKSLSMKELDPNDAKECSKWQRSYKKGRLIVLLYIEPSSIIKQYIYK
ncbi:hypothetical protein [Serratia sp. DD3]|uniref:hypothetical protein n=1 Tax=Serratia sp. DD3 TaxID=1410619 RepID=UPI0004D8BD87|nr:hypothetical protein [Serratia sp. DD3]KEY59843.1 hypothetical protein SRDD_11820 [Serratia sp. DD3]